MGWKGSNKIITLISLQWKACKIPALKREGRRQQLVKVRHALLWLPRGLYCEGREGGDPRAEGIQFYVARTRSFIEGKGLGDKSERSSSLVEILPENFYDFVSRYRDFKHMHCHFM